MGIKYIKVFISPNHKAIPAREAKVKRKEDMYYWIRRAIFPVWRERLVDWLYGRQK